VNRSSDGTPASDRAASRRTIGDIGTDLEGNDAAEPEGPDVGSHGISTEPLGVERRSRFPMAGAEA
jgi:hypothetical protein